MTAPILSSLVSPLTHVLFVLGADRVSVSELLGFLTGAWCVWLTVRASIANFPVGIANDVFFLVLFLAARLYADTGLQAVYVVLGMVGWWQWAHGGRGRTAREITRTGALTTGALAAAVVAGTGGLTWLLRAAHDAAPFWDALTTSLSLAAQWLLNLKKLENWFVWAAADAIYVPFYLVQRLDLTGVVYGAFLCMCAAGYISWARPPASSSARAGRPELRA